MSMLAQVGYGKKTLVQDALNAGSIGGVVLSARSEHMDAVEPFVSGLCQTNNRSVRLLDPQCYMQTIPDVDLGHLDEYPFLLSPLQLDSLQSDSYLPPREVIDWVRLTVDYQLQLPVTHVLSPTMFVTSLSSPSFSKSLDLAAETLAYMRERGEDSSRLLLSLCLDHQTLADTRNLNALLNRMTSMANGAATGFYIVIGVDQDEREPFMDSHSLAALMRICYGLGKLNERMVHVAFVGYAGLLLQAVGATSTSAGWFTKERRFAKKDYLPKDILRQPLERYSSSKLMTSVLVNPNLLNYVRLVGPEEILTDTGPTTLQPIVAGKITPWSVRTDCSHFWSDMTERLALLDQYESVTDRLGIVESWLHEAGIRWTRIRDAGYPVPAGDSKHIDTMLAAAREFRNGNDI